MREKGVPQKYVRIVKNMYEDVKTMVRSSVGETQEFTVKVCLHQGSALYPYIFDLILDVIVDTVIPTLEHAVCRRHCPVWKDREEVEKMTEEWRGVVEERGLKVSRKKMEYMPLYKEGKETSSCRITP